MCKGYRGFGSPTCCFDASCERFLTASQIEVLMHAE